MNGHMSEIGGVGRCTKCGSNRLVCENSLDSFDIGDGTVHLKRGTYDKADVARIQAAAAYVAEHRGAVILWPR